MDYRKDKQLSVIMEDSRDMRATSNLTLIDSNNNAPWQATDD